MFVTSVPWHSAFPASALPFYGMSHSPLLFWVQHQAPGINTLTSSTVISNHIADDDTYDSTHFIKKPKYKGLTRWSEQGLKLFKQDLQNEGIKGLYSDPTAEGLYPFSPYLSWRHIRLSFHETSSVVHNDTSPQSPNCPSTENTDDLVPSLT